MSEVYTQFRQYDLFHCPMLMLEFDFNDRYGEKYVSYNPSLIGYKGAQFLEPGYVFAPYIPVFDAIDIVEDPEEERKLEEMFAPKKSLTERYSQKTINENFYTQVTIIGQYYTGTTFTEII